VFSIIQKNNDTFCHKLLVFDMSFLICFFQFVKSCRTADFSLSMETLDSLMPWIFALDHTHYARNLPIHLRDMATLEERHPALYVEFKCHGHFMGQKTRRAFSWIPRDQMHEQLIDWLKNLAGVIENLDDPRTVRREQVVRPEMARLSGKWTEQRSQMNGCTMNSTPNSRLTTR